MAKSTVKTTRISNIIDGMDNAAYIEDAQQYIRKALRNDDGTYTLNHHRGWFPAFDTDTYDTIEELCAAMKQFAPLSHWKQQYNAAGENTLE
jgi:hypothetical protein